MYTIIFYQVSQSWWSIKHYGIFAATITQLYFTFFYLLCELEKKDIYFQSIAAENQKEKNETKLIK